MAATILLLALVIALTGQCVTAAPVAASNFLGFDSLFGPALFAPQAPSGDEVKIKRSTISLTPDARSDLKQSISLQSLIDNVEHNLYDTAYSVSHMMGNAAAAAVPQEETAAAASSTTAKRINTRHTDDAQRAGNTAATSASAVATNSPLTSTASPPATTSATLEHTTDLQVLLQTTKMVPSAQNAGTPQILLIDRIAVQPYLDGSQRYIIPAFQLQPITLRAVETTPAENTAVLQVATAATTVATDTAAVHSTLVIPHKDVILVAAHPEPATVVAEATTDAVTTHSDVTTAATTETTTTTTTAATTTSTSMKPTKKPVEELQEAEKELKEKVAEIEADPVILSARV